MKQNIDFSLAVHDDEYTGYVEYEDGKVTASQVLNHFDDDIETDRLDKLVAAFFGARHYPEGVSELELTVEDETVLEKGEAKGILNAAPGKGFSVDFTVKGQPFTVNFPDDDHDSITDTWDSIEFQGATYDVNVFVKDDTGFVRLSIYKLTRNANGGFENDGVPRLVKQVKITKVNNPMVKAYANGSFKYLGKL